MTVAALPPIRRLATVEGAGGGEIVSDGAVGGGRVVCDGVLSTHVWATGAAPAYDADSDGAALLAGAPPPPGGTRTGFLDLEPGAVAGGLHRTDTIDYAVCIHGVVELDLGTERRLLQPGDIVVQCGATHTWRNPGMAAARLLFVMIDAAEKRPGSLARSQPVA